MRVLLVQTSPANNWLAPLIGHLRHDSKASTSNSTQGALFAERISYAPFDVRRACALTFDFPFGPVFVALLFPDDSSTNRLIKIARFYTGADSESHFEDIEVELNPIRNMAASALQPTHGIMFRFAPPTHLSSYHPAP